MIISLPGTVTCHYATLGFAWLACGCCSAVNPQRHVTLQHQHPHLPGWNKAIYGGKWVQRSNMRFHDKCRKRSTPYLNLICPSVDVYHQLFNSSIVHCLMRNSTSFYLNQNSLVCLENEWTFLGLANYASK